MTRSRGSVRQSIFRWGWCRANDIALFDNNLKLGIHLINHLVRTQRSIATDNIIPTLIRALEPQYELEKSMSPEERVSPPKVEFSVIFKTMEKIIDCLNSCSGESGFCLGYVVRKLLIPIVSNERKILR